LECTAYRTVKVTKQYNFKDTVQKWVYSKHWIMNFGSKRKSPSPIYPPILEVLHCNLIIAYYSMTLNT